MKILMNIKLIAILGLFSLAAQAATPGGGLVGNGKTSTGSTTDASTPPPADTPAPTPKPETKKQSS